jgi:hypothetical protein
MNCDRLLKWQCVKVSRCILVGLLCAMLASCAAPAARPAARAQDEVGAAIERVYPDLVATLESSQELSNQADQMLFMQDGSGLHTQNAEPAKALYNRSNGIIADLMKKHASTYDEFPLMFTQTDYIRARNARGLATVALATGDTEASAKYRQETVDIAEAVRQLVGSVSADADESYGIVDRESKSLISEAHMWLGLDYMMAGNSAKAREHFTETLNLTDDPQQRAEIQQILNEIK